MVPLHVNEISPGARHTHQSSGGSEIQLTLLGPTFTRNKHGFSFLLKVIKMCKRPSYTRLTYTVLSTHLAKVSFSLEPLGRGSHFQDLQNLIFIRIALLINNCDCPTQGITGMQEMSFCKPQAGFLGRVHCQEKDGKGWNWTNSTTHRLYQRGIPLPFHLLATREMTRK